MSTVLVRYEYGMHIRYEYGMSTVCIYGICSSGTSERISEKSKNNGLSLAQLLVVSVTGTETWLGLGQCQD